MAPRVCDPMTPSTVSFNPRMRLSEPWIHAVRTGPLLLPCRRCFSACRIELTEFGLRLTEGGFELAAGSVKSVLELAEFRLKLAAGNFGFEFEWLRANVAHDKLPRIWSASWALEQPPPCGPQPQQPFPE
jgi:hypothetical protein